ncbi:MAG: Rhamnogalacturonan acetylesterase RhgT [Verrucomicrobia subdivision 3 bacterium]|nr:Rhamnogalacturonan acetylesterase RhgT [Limisphaerales bacterium]MCS1415568.1 Rhamnogalacturonan acetylesterase RhgT [Limisphaerales bacterium]
MQKLNQKWGEWKFVVLCGLALCCGWTGKAQVATFQAVSGVSFKFPVEAGRAYKSLLSTDLSTWQPFGDTFLPSDSIPWIFPNDSHGFVQLVPDFNINETDLRIVIIGDSTVADLSFLSQQFHGWGQVLGDFFQENVVFVNQAGPGVDTVRFVENNSIKQVEIVKPHVVMMQFGHIDDDNSLSEEVFETNLRAIVASVRAIGAIPMLVTPVSRRIFDDAGNLINKLSKRRESMFELSAQERVQVIDLNKRSSDLYKRYGESATTFVTVCGNQCDDRSHFSRTGSYIMAGLAADEFPALLQAYRIPLEDLSDEILGAFENDRKFESLSTPFVGLTGFQDEALWEWVFQAQ